MVNLLSPITIRNANIKNRIVMPPMVCFGYSNADGLVTEQNLRHYEARAKGGAGLIIVEATCVSKNGRLAPVQLGLWSDDQIEGFAKIAAACHRYGARVLVQIHHAGLGAPPSVTRELVSASDFSGRLRNSPVSARALTVDEIHQIEDDFVAAAMRAQKAGLDGVELHGAHGYLISQFASPVINKRRDSYGGSAANRSRLAAEIIQKVRKAAGNDFIIEIRAGCNEPDLKDGIEIAKQLEKAGADMLHVSTGMSTLLGSGFEAPFPVPPDFKYSWVVYGGAEIKKRVKIPVIVVNGIRTPEQADYLVANNLADFTAIGKGLLVDPDWANKVQENQKVVTCLDCKMCAYFKPGSVAGAECPRNKEKAESR